MTLENLLKIGQLKSHVTDRSEVQPLLEAARRNLADADVAAISLETRFDAAYKAIMQLALVALLAHGYRADSRGHHQIMLQSLPLTIGLSKDRMIVLDAMRRKRNAADYLGSYVDQGSVEVCMVQATELLMDVERWLRENRPELL
ncbi:MAG: DNA-binding protein [Deltaproteobacteria bacterium]|nr:MAG: DNA-binding protein [Deltaproteobacteria bacterium]